MGQRLTVVEISERMGLQNRDVARGFVKLCENMKICRKMGVRTAYNGFGRGEHVYEFDDDYIDSLVELFKKAALV